MAQIRGPGIPFPLTSPAGLSGAPGCVCLQSGGIFEVPQGEFLVIPGQQTVLEFFDYWAGQWRGTQVYQGQIEQISSDGGNYRLVNLSGVVVGASITAAGSGNTNGIGPVQTGVSIAFGAPAAGGATATAVGYVVVGGSVPAPTVTQGGSGFTCPPVIACDPPPAGGIQATFTSTISSAGVLTGVTQVNPGAGYLSAPNFYIIPQPQFGYQAPRWPGDVPALQPGSVINYPAPGLINPANVWPGSMFQANVATGALGALLTSNALTGSGTVTAIVMVHYGAGYTGSTLPAITFTGASGSPAATAIMSFCSTVAPGSALTGQTGATYVVGMPIVSTLGLIAQSSDNNLFTPRPIRGKVTNATGPVLTVEDPGFGIQSAGTGVTLGPGGGTVGNVAAANLGGATDSSILQGGVQ